MKRAERIILTTILLVSGVISFSIARMTAIAAEKSHRNTSHQWTNALPDNLIELEKRFDVEYDELIKVLISEQKSLASILADASATDKAIIEQAEIVSQAHEKLMRSAAEHIIKIHRKLPLVQKDLLMQFCAESLQGSDRTLDEARGAYCRDCRRKCGLPCPGSCSLKDGLECCKSCTNTTCPARGKGFAQILMLSEQQLEAIKQQDPAFAADSKKLRQRLIEQRSKLLEMFEDPQTKDQDLLQQVDHLISAHRAIEKRVAEYVVLLRPHLTQEQQKWLIGLCFRKGEVLDTLDSTPQHK